MDELSAAQLSEWEAYDKLDPIGSWRDDYRMAVLDALIVNIVSRLYSKKGRSSKEVTPMDFMPNWSGEKKEVRKQSMEEMKQALLSFAKTVNKRIEANPTYKRPPVRKLPSKNPMKRKPPIG